jgi:beta-1,4-mannosyl-glycoprotein beta-1,4-N-acetylglucosaminyltransferase
VTKVYDCFLFNGEWDILELRLNTHDSVVDYFVIVESCFTFVGDKKSLTFDIHHEAVDRFRHKIRYILITDMPNDGNPWNNEIHQRNCLTRGLWDADHNDLVIISDCDEIIKPIFIEEAVRETSFDVFGFQQPHYYCFLNYKMTGLHADKIMTVAVRNHLLKLNTPTWYRGNIEAGVFFWFGNAGWHYSYMMDTEGIRNKIGSYSHTEFNTPQIVDNLDQRSQCLAGQDILGREWISWQRQNLDEVDLPEYVRQHWHKYQKYILE